MHGYGAVYQLRVGGEGVIFGGREGLVFEFLPKLSVPWPGEYWGAGRYLVECPAVLVQTAVDGLQVLLSGIHGLLEGVVKLGEGYGCHLRVCGGGG